jgi:hypothetical protein
MARRSHVRKLARAFLLVLIPLFSGTRAGRGIPAGIPSLSAQEAVTSGTIKALTYNVAGLPPGMSKTKPIQSMLRIGPILNDYDLVLVQEDFLFHRLLTIGARHDHQSEPQPLSGIVSRDFLRRVRGLSLSVIDDVSGFLGESRLTNDGLNPFSNFPFTDFERHPWIACHGLTLAANDCLAPKGFTYARHEIAPGVVVDVYNVHGDAGRSPEDEAARRAEFQQLADFIKERSAGLPVIIAGDTNLQAIEPADEATLQEFMAATGVAIAARTLGQVLNRTTDVDRFFYRGSDSVSLTPTLREEAGEFFHGRGNPMSDHPAIRVDFSWKIR